MNRTEAVENSSLTYEGKVHPRCGTKIKYVKKGQCVFCSCVYKYGEYDPVKTKKKNQAYQLKLKTKHIKGVL